METTVSRVAALYVMERSSPYRLLDVDMWPESRDARTWPGGCPCVTHADCGPWSRSWSHACQKGPEVAAMAPLAIGQVRENGGIFEHPSRSLLWDVAHLALPLPVPWELLRPWECPGYQMYLAMPDIPRDAFGGFTVEVELCWWTTEEEPIAWRKPTWLYCVGLNFDEVVDALPSPCDPAIPPKDPGFRSDKPTQRRAAIDIVSPETRQRTPAAMARWLVDLAARAEVG